MPNLFYNLVKIKRERQKQLCGGASSARLAKNSPVFHFLETRFANNPIGTIATYAAPGKGGQRGYYVYERTTDGFLLIKRNFFAQDGTLLRREMPSPPKNLRNQSSLTNCV